MTAPRFPATNSTPARGTGAPGATVQLTLEEARLMIAIGAVIAPTEMVNTVAPVVTGTAQVGETLTCTQGTWTGDDGIYRYEWQADHGGGFNRILSGSAASTFVPTTQELGATLRCRVRGVNAAGPIYGYSNETAAVIAA